MKYFEGETHPSADWLFQRGLRIGRTTGQSECTGLSHTHLLQCPCLHRVYIKFPHKVVFKFLLEW